MSLPPPPPPKAPTGASRGTLTCYRHPNRDAGRRCTRCGKPACAECTYGTTKQDRSHGETGAYCLRTERLCQGVDGPVNDAAVETEKKATDRGYAAKCDYIGGTTSSAVVRRGRNGIIHSEFFSFPLFSSR